MKSHSKPPLSSSKDLMSSLMKGLKKAADPGQWYRQIEWSRYLDEEWAKAITGVRYQRQTLFLSTNSSLFSHYFQHTKEAVLAKLREDYADHVIQDIRCKVG